MITYQKHSIIKSDTAIDYLFDFLALGIILIGVANSSTDLFHILAGNILAVQRHGYVDNDYRFTSRTITTIQSSFASTLHP